MLLTGSDNERPMPQCKTKDLDHPNVPDFGKGSSIFVASKEEQDMGWYTCWNAPLDGMVTAASVTWTGSGTFYPWQICFDWDKENSLVSICKAATGITLNNGESVDLSCETGDATECHIIS